MFKNGTTLIVALLFALTFSVAAFAQGDDLVVIQLGKDCTHRGHLDCMVKGGQPALCRAGGGNPESCKLVANPGGVPPWTSCFCRPNPTNANANECECWKKR